MSLTEAQNAMQRLLAEHGRCSPLELLLATNRLGYEDYRAWRRGERATLDGVWLGKAQDVRTLLLRLRRWAESLNLDEQIASLYGIDERAGVGLVASKDPALDGLLCMEFLAAGNRAQLDLFLDTGETAALGDLVNALASRDADAAERRLQELEAINPGSWAIADARVLVDALRAPPPDGVEQGFRRLALLEQRWLPAANAILRGEARDFLAPIWRSLGQLLDGTPFEADRPRRHAAWAYLHGLDWVNVKQSIEATPGHARQPLLLGWLAVAHWRLREREAAIEGWFELCWRHSAHFVTVVEASDFPDGLVRQAWLNAQDEDLAPAISPAWFPAWMLIEEPGLAKTLTRSGGETDPERTFDTLLALNAGGSDRQNMDNRRTLQALHPGLLKHYMDALESAEAMAREPMRP